MKTPKRPRDFSQRAKLIVDLATGAKKEEPIEDLRNPHAVALGKLGGMIGGRARAKSLSAKRRSAIAQKAAKTRWNKKKVTA